MGHQVFTVNLYELPSIVFVFPGKAQELFYGFLLHVLKAQQLAVGLYFFVDIQADDGIKIIIKPQTAAAFQQIRDVKAVPVKMYKDPEPLHEGKEAFQELGLRFPCIRKPLD